MRLHIAGSFIQTEIKRTRLNEQEIINGCQRQDAQSQKLLFDLYAGRMMALCQRYARDQQEAQDFLQLGFIKIFERIHQFRNDGSFEGWMRKLFARIAIREISRNKINFGDIDTLAQNLESDMAGALSKISEEEIHQLIRRLPDGYRIVFNLFVIDGYSHEEIAKMLGIKQATSRTQLLKGRKMLQALIIHRYNHTSV